MINHRIRTADRNRCRAAEERSKLKITCAKDSTMQSYLESNYPKVSIVQPKK